ncbi:MAG: hypothetical protein LUF89_04470 [Ruminococcus sp.]|nr:hypothetical protein [Ruminococcus sp.]
MKRMMVWVGLPWMLGLFLATYFGNPLENSLTLCLLPVAWMLLGAVCILCKIKVKQVLCIGISFTAAFCSVICYTLFAYFSVMQHDGTADTFSGKVTSVVTYNNDWASYQVKGKFSDGTKAKILVFTEDVGAEYGDVLDIAESFSVPESSYLWDGTSYYRAKGIFLETSYDSFVTCTHTENGKLVRVLEKYRERIT